MGLDPGKKGGLAWERARKGCVELGLIEAEGPQGGSRGRGVLPVAWRVPPPGFRARHCSNSYRINWESGGWGRERERREDEGGDEAPEFPRGQKAGFLLAYLVPKTSRSWFESIEVNEGLTEREALRGSKKKNRLFRAVDHIL